MAEVWVGPKGTKPWEGGWLPLGLPDMGSSVSSYDYYSGLEASLTFRNVGNEAMNLLYGNKPVKNAPITDGKLVAGMTYDDPEDLGKALKLLVPGDKVQARFDGDVTVGEHYAIGTVRAGGLYDGTLFVGHSCLTLARNVAVRTLKSITIHELAPRKPDWWGADIIQHIGYRYIFDKQADGYRADTGSLSTEGSFRRLTEPVTVIVDKDGRIPAEAFIESHGGHQGVLDKLRRWAGDTSAVITVGNLEAIFGGAK